MKKILDISKHQGNIDFNKMKKNSIDGVMCRCSYSGFKDSRFEEYYSQISKSNIPMGAYAYCTWHYTSFSVNRASAVIAAESESNKVIQILKNKNIQGPVAIDLEFESGQSTVLTKEEMTYVANLYMDKLKKAGYTPILYCSISWLFDYMICAKIKYPLWIAYFNKAGFNGTAFPDTKYGALMNMVKDKIWMWQYTSSGNGGLYGTSSKNVDLNHCYCSFGTTSNKLPYNEPKETACIYTVKRNDNLTKISKAYGIRIQELLKTNPQIINPNLIHIGDKIKIPTNSKKNTNKIKIGDTVRLKKGSKTYNGKTIASFVFNNNYKVDKLKGNRAVLDIKGICTPVNICDLTEV